jgi:hypothetical protein
MAIMKREEPVAAKSEKKKGFSEAEFIDYLEERFRELRLDEQKFRDEILLKHSEAKSSQSSKIEIEKIIE